MSSEEPHNPYGRPGEHPPAPQPYGYAPAQPPHQQYGSASAQPQLPYGYQAVAPKNPAVSLLISFFLPGVGSMVNGDVEKGVGILIGYVISLVLTIILIGFLGMFGFWVWGMVDAYQGAQRWNHRHGILS